MQVVIVTGSVGSGKSTISKWLSKELNFEYIDVNEVIKREGLSINYDPRRKTKVIDEQKLSRALIKIIKNSKSGLVIDSHMSHFLPKEHVDLCIVTKCEISELAKRLKARKYGTEKVQENLQCEIFDICLNESRELGHNILVIDTTKNSFFEHMENNVSKPTKGINMKRIFSQVVEHYIDSML